MKIKTDFVTNSSSTSYIVYVPEGTAFERLVITDGMKERLHELADEYDSDEPNPDDTRAGLNELKRIFNMFLKDGSFYEGDSYTAFSLLMELFDENNLVLLRSEGAPDSGVINLFKRLHVDKIEDINRRMS